MRAKVALSYGAFEGQPLICSGDVGMRGHVPHGDKGEVDHLTPVVAGDAATLLAIIRRLCRARSQEEIMAVVSHGVRTLLHADGGAFVLREGDRCYYADEDAISPLWKGRRIPMSGTIAGWCMINNRPAAIPDIYQDARVAPEVYRPTFVRSLAMAPVGHDQPVAALGAYWSEMRQPQPEEVDLLCAIADAAALAVANVRLQQAGPSKQGRVASDPVNQSREPKESAPPARGSLRSFLERARREGLRPNSLEAYVFAVFCVLAATLVRLGVDAIGVPGRAIFATFFPAVLIAVLAGGTRAGVLAAALGGFAAYWVFMPPQYQFVPLTPGNVLDLSLYFSGSGLIVLIVDRHQRTVARLRLEDATNLTLAREQGHRIRNAVTVVEGIVQQSLRDEPERARTISQRVRAGLAEVDVEDLAAATPVDLRDLLTAELLPHDPSRIALQGEAVPLDPQARRSVALAAHELTTNALKYGALSVPEGRVTVEWSRLDGRVVIHWREDGGPPVKPPRKRGFGTIMLRRVVEAAGGALTMEFRPTGMTAEISLPLR
jgi:two-component sensor histidine kinase